MAKLRFRRCLLLTLLGLAALPLAFHFGVRALSPLSPPEVVVTRKSVVVERGQTRRFGRSEAWFGSGLNLVRLEGGPEEIGTAHTHLLYGKMIDLERRLLNRFSQYVPRSWSRALLLDLARLRFYDVDQGMSLLHRRELAAMSVAFSPDPYSDLFPTYQRLVYLNALYDISLSFESSPLLGCTSLFVAGDPKLNQHTLFGRNFDFEVDPVFDEQKTLFVVKETGRLPYLSLSWPGLIGAVTGVNQKGLAMVVHGGRAGELSRTGEPVLHVLRDVLGQAENVDQAYALLGQHSIMVSHIIVMADRMGQGRVVERVPQMPDYRYDLEPRAVVTNHLLGPSAMDKKNLRILAGTSTEARKARALELLVSAPSPVEPQTLIGMLRDRHAKGGTPLHLGDRRSLGALIAAHGVVFDLTELRLWVGGTPTLLGDYFGLTFDELFDAANPLSTLVSRAPKISADPLLQSPEYKRYLQQLQR